MEVASPAPRFEYPRVSAPQVARDPRGLVPPPEPASAPDSFAAKAIDRIPDALPSWATNALFTASRAVNNVVFKSPPGGAPVPKSEDSWTFGAIGDYGSGREPLTDVSKQILKSKPEVLLTLGDNVYYKGHEDEFQRKWDPPQYFGEVHANLPVMPSLGNHDLEGEPDGAPYFKRFPQLEKARFYSFEHKGVHFASLNSNESLAPGSPQHEWLKQDLEKSKDDWKVLYLHHPLRSGYPKSKHPLADQLKPLIDQYGVDLVLSGHEHSYQRSTPFNDKGAIEVVAGGGGQSLHPFFSGLEKHTAYRDVDFGHLEVEVNKDKLVGRYVVRDGQVRDTFVLPNLTPGTWQAAQGAAAVQPAPAPAVAPVEAATA